MPLSPDTESVLRDLAKRPANHDNVKASFKELLVREFGMDRGALDFEVRAPVIAGRLDALVGRTVFEAKRDLTAEWPDVERRMPDYLADREREYGEPFVGIASDGSRWVALELRDGALARLTETVLDPDKGEAFLAWLDGVVALKASLPPDPLTVRAELGQDSIAFRLVDRELRAAWDRLKDDPAQALKRQLWANLLKLVYGREVQGDSLWFQHTYLVIVAKCIALAVMDLREDDPARMLSGEAFSAAGIHGAVESDFFDWVTADTGGIALVRRVMAHVRRFRLREVESDVLKILYESLIDRDERHGLGEYYTPDWLAAKVVRHAVERPLEQRVLDPACGSGTFLFHAIRRFLGEAEESGMSKADRAAEACAQVAGLDIHPVAVIIARVTYLLGLAPALAGRSGALSVPVWLGDAMQLSISKDLAGRELVIQVPPPPAGNGSKEQLSFPETFCRDPALFDKAIAAMRRGSEASRSRDQVETDIGRRTEQHYKRDLTPEERTAISDLGATYETFHKLRIEGRDTIWSYVARNLSRPLALASGGGWANVLVGNPPWVAYRHMSADLQKRFKELGRGEKVYVGGRFATQNDLSALFTVRASHLYLRPSGRIAFVLPLAALTRGQFEKFRAGQFGSYNIAWDEAWTMDDSVAPLFPVPSCVIFGRKRAIARAVPRKVRAYSGWLPMRDAPESTADAKLALVIDAPAPQPGEFTGGSPYRASFRQGATLVPRMLCLVDRKGLGRLGPDESAPLVSSRRSVQEKNPWKSLPGVKHQVETEFLRPVLLGESILPYRLLQVFEGVIPVDAAGEVLTADMAANSERGHDKLAGWMREAEALWANNSAGTMTLADRWNFHRGLSNQFPIPPLRVLYAASGTQPAAVILRDEHTVIEHKLYWTTPSSEEEAHYLAAVLNSEAVRAGAERYQSRGQFGARDFDKVMFNLPIPLFSHDNALHRAIAQAGAHAETVAAVVELVEAERFQRARKRIRDALAEEGIGDEIEKLVEKLLDG
jgi:SAM-dependent methyltransferase